MLEEKEWKEYMDYRYRPEQVHIVNRRLQELIHENKKLFVVIDDDPTGGQTAHGLTVYMSWSEEIILDAFRKTDRMFYIMTNSRSMPKEETARVHEEIMHGLNYAAGLTGREFEVISRSDSTLRGHYPLETDIIGRHINGGVKKELIIPFFQEGNRYTINDIHCLYEEGAMIPAGESEFSKDKTFGYKNSDLKLWIEEKTQGKYPAGEADSVSLEMLRTLDFKGIGRILTKDSGQKIIVNSTCYMDLMVFAVCYYEALGKGISFVARTASAWPKVVGDIPDIPYIRAEDIVDLKCGYGGLVIVGSHVRKTSEQLEMLRYSHIPLEFIEFNQHLAVEAGKLENEVKRVSSLANTLMKEGKTVVVYTKRERIDFNSGSKEEELNITNRIADAVTGIAEGIEMKPRFVIVKGGITSSDVAVKAFRTKKAEIIGQAAAGVPVWKLGTESKYPGMAYVVFPGNVGTKDTLKEVVEELARL